MVDHICECNHCDCKIKFDCNESDCFCCVYFNLLFRLVQGISTKKESIMVFQ